MATISYFEAWRLWFAGQQPPGDAALWIMSVRWWGRAGKIAAFVGGATVILDLIGPERLRRFGRRLDYEDSFKAFFRDEWKMLFLFIWVPSGAIIALVIVAAMVIGNLNLTLFLIVVLSLCVSGLLVTVLVVILVVGLPRMLEVVLNRRNPAMVLRHVGLVLLFAGFHFDLLAS